MVCVPLLVSRREQMADMVTNRLADGSVKAKIHLTEGIDKAADGFIDMLEGRNFGKAVLKIKDE